MEKKYRLNIEKQEQKCLMKKVQIISGKSWVAIADEFSVNRRTLNDWRAARTRIPFSFVKKAKKYFNDYSNLPLVEEYNHLASAARKGGLQRMKLYGNIGTAEGRKRGGINAIHSMKIHNFKSDFFNEKKIKVPNQDADLAELVGIILGDGHLDKYQATVTLDLTSDIPYVSHVVNLFNKLFCLTPSVYYRKYKNTIDVTLSSVRAIDFLVDKGMKRGNKILNNVGIPVWIKNDPKLIRHCLRGLFDTDGAVYFDYHHHKSSFYKHICIQFDSHIPKLLHDVSTMLDWLGFNHKKYKDNIKLRRNNEIEKFLQEIGFSNPKNLAKYHNFIHNL